MRTVKDRVIVLADELADKSEGGIYLPENREERDRMGIVVATGKDCEVVRIGQRVVYNVYSEMVELNGKKYRVLKEENVLMIVQKSDKVRVTKKDSQGKVSWENLD